MCIRDRSIPTLHSINGICRCLDTMQGGNRQPKVLVKEATKKGYSEAMIGDSINLRCV